MRAPKDAATRPTSDRAREGLFDWLGPLVPDGHPAHAALPRGEGLSAPGGPGFGVLDLFAGTGAVGIEALSRGAVRAVFVESRRPALESLAANLADLDLRDCSRVLRRDVRAFLRAVATDGDAVGALGGAFGLVFADPPYADRGSADLLASPALPRLLAPGGRLVIERDRDAERAPARGRSAPHAVAAPPALCTNGLVLRESRAYGRTTFDWYERGDVQRSEDANE